MIQLEANRSTSHRKLRDGFVRIERRNDELATKIDDHEKSIENAINSPHREIFAGVEKLLGKVNLTTIGERLAKVEKELSSPEEKTPTAPVGA